MTTQEFIQKSAGVPSTKDRHCSSVFADQDGNIYSYGFHYPLLFKVGRLQFRNCSGYSNTTAKHINWAGGHGAVDIWVSGCNQYSWRNSENAAKIPHLLYLAKYGMTPEIEKALKKAIKADLRDELKDINNRIASKKRTNTAIYAALITERDNCLARIETVKRGL